MIIPSFNRPSLFVRREKFMLGLISNKLIYTGSQTNQCVINNWYSVTCSCASRGKCYIKRMICMKSVQEEDIKKTIKGSWFLYVTRLCRTLTPRCRTYFGTMEAKHCLRLAAASTDTHTAQTWHRLHALVLLILSFVDYCSVCWFYSNHSDKGSWTRAHCSWFLLTGDVNPINSQNFV